MPKGGGVTQKPLGAGSNIYETSANNMTNATNIAGDISRTTLPSTAPGSIQSGMQTYNNPYTSQVINRTRNDINFQRDQALAAVRGDANAAGAFGGSRHGLVEGQVHGEASDAFAREAAGLRRQGFMDRAGLANQDIVNQQKHYNDVASRGVAIGDLMKGLSGQAFEQGSALTGQQMVAGQQVQQQNQKLMDLVQSMFGAYADAPANALNNRISTVGMNPLSGVGTSTSQTSKSLGPADYMVAALGGLGNALQMSYTFGG